jgi:hypothetical protein
LDLLLYFTQRHLQFDFYFLLAYAEISERRLQELEELNKIGEEKLEVPVLLDPLDSHGGLEMLHRQV